MFLREGGNSTEDSLAQNSNALGPMDTIFNPITTDVMGHSLNAFAGTEVYAGSEVSSIAPLQQPSVADV